MGERVLSREELEARYAALKDPEDYLELFLRHLRKGHKRTTPFRNVQDLKDTVNYDENDHYTVQEGITEVERWHSEQHEKTFMVHILSPWYHV